ncbi:hypothetical protein [Actinomadura geliboluensis]|uniref:Uncharacterized protein n=1 Tax=Actinomadura geliboluensis TaxID=882440 RepID=A0A5S4G2X5_9ACTN|nr:hypothetical protein [Actinomadura geliboluensis]TMR27318.1 hypothetical protein ETD96_39600 [Actinomadura geliboluensis]
MDRFTENDFGPYHRFVELMEFEEAASLAARHILYGHPPHGPSFPVDHGYKKPRRPPDSHHAVLRLPQRHNIIGHYNDALVFTGSIYRLADGRVVLYWHDHEWDYSD